MKTLAVVLVWLVIATEVMAKIALFMIWAVILGFSAWMFGGATRDFYRWIRVKFVPLEKAQRHAA